MFYVSITKFKELICTVWSNCKYKFLKTDSIGSVIFGRAAILSTDFFLVNICPTLSKAQIINKKIAVFFGHLDLFFLKLVLLVIVLSETFRNPGFLDFVIVRKKKIFFLLFGNLNNFFVCAKNLFFCP